MIEHRHLEAVVALAWHADPLVAATELVDSMLRSLVGLVQSEATVDGSDGLTMARAMQPFLNTWAGQEAHFTS